MPLFGPPNVEKLRAKNDIPGLIKALHYDKDPTIVHAAARALGQASDPQAIEPLVATLRNEDDATLRATALQALGQLGATSQHDVFVTALKDKQPEVRKASINALGKLGDPQSIDPLIDLFKRQDADLYPDVLQALIQISAKLAGAERQSHLFEPLGSLLPDADKPTRLALIDALQHMGWQPGQDFIGATYYVLQKQWDRCIALGEAAAAPLVAALNDEDKQVRQDAFQALVSIGVPAAPALIHALQAADNDVRQAAFWALVKIGQPVRDPLIEALGHENEDVRRACATALGHLGDPQVVIPLIGLFSDIDWSVRRDAYKAIIKIGRPALQELLAALKHENGEIRWGAAGTLEALGWKPSKDEIGARFWITKGEWHKCIEIGAPAVAPLIESLGHWDTNVCKESMGVLVHIGAPSVQPLIAALERPEPAVKKCAATALGMIGDEQAEQPLMQLLSDRDKDVSQAASEAISAIQTGEVWRGTS